MSTHNAQEIQHQITDQEHNPNAYAELKAKTPLHKKISGSLIMDIAEHVTQLLATKGKTRRDLARMMEKTDSEISKWLNGTHNLTIESIGKLSAALGVDLLISPAFPEGYFGQPQQSVIAPSIHNKPLDDLMPERPSSSDLYDPTMLATLVKAKEYSYAMAA